MINLLLRFALTFELWWHGYPRNTWSVARKYAVQNYQRNRDWDAALDAGIRRAGCERSGKFLP